MKFCAVIVLVSTIILSVNGQGFGNCTAEDLQRDLNDIGLECAIAFTVVFNDEHLPIPEEDLEAALDVLCTAECGLAVGTYLVLQCHELGFPFLLKTFCLPSRRSRGEYCRQSYPDSINTTVVNSLLKCSNPEECEAGCENALVDISYELGCCYQALYNSSVALFLSEIFFVEQTYPIYSISNPALWTDCDVPLMEFCPGLPFPRKTPLPCDVRNFIIRELPSHCEDSHAIAINPSTAFTDRGMEAYEDICDEECFEPLINYIDLNCKDPIGTIIMGINCLESDGNLGRRCRFSLDERIEDTGIFQAVGEHCENAFSGSRCSGECRDSLVEMSNALGCCYQSIYNNTELITLLLLINELNPDDALFFGIVGNETLWNNCGVPLIGECKPSSSAAVNIVYSKKITFLSVNLLALIYYMMV